MKKYQVKCGDTYLGHFKASTPTQAVDKAIASYTRIVEIPEGVYDVVVSKGDFVGDACVHMTERVSF